MDDAVRDAVLGNLVRDSDAVRDSVEIVRQRRAGDRVTTLARWTEARTGRLRRGAVDVVTTDGAWRASGGWSVNANHDHDNPVWDAWGGSSHSMSGWVSDPAAATVRFRHPDGSRVEADTVENGVTILIYDTAADRGSIIEILDRDGNVLHTTPSA
jgi:hypothetical protein